VNGIEDVCVSKSNVFSRRQDHRQMFSVKTDAVKKDLKDEECFL
jgi:hypothetical protein